MPTHQSPETRRLQQVGMRQVREAQREAYRRLPIIIGRLDALEGRISTIERSLPVGHEMAGLPEATSPSENDNA